MQKKTVLSIKVNSDHPQCEHGPSILFETDKEKYYACSAFRDQKLCNFKLKINEVNKKRKVISRKIIKPSLKLKEFLAYDKNKRFYCHNCCKLFSFSKSEDKSKVSCFKSKHDISSSVSETDINFPTRFLDAATNNKANAQYLFSDDFLTYLLATFHSLNIDKVVCIGAPRLHENLINNFRLGKSNIKSFLLDIDDRLMQFHEDSFALYNMFNNHFLIEDHIDKFNNFLALDGNVENILLFCDPPFGGLIEPLCITLTILMELCTNQGYNVNKMLILPYFLGKKVEQYSCDLKMLDYRVLYGNHKRMDRPDNRESDNVQGNRRESVVRIFTDYKANVVKPPNDNTYLFCKPCDRYSHKDNEHCMKCNKCTTRHGQCYVHCYKCDKCRQANKKHCDKCGFCNSPDHKCINK